MANQNLRMKDFLSIQPLWKIERSQGRIYRDFSNQEVAEVFSFSTDSDFIECIPGNGMTALVLSTDPENPFVKLCGPLSQRNTIPLSGVHNGVYCRFFPGKASDLFHIPYNELADSVLSLDDIMPLGSTPAQFAEAKDEDERQLILFKFLDNFSCRGGNILHQKLSQHLIHEILDKNGDIRISELAKETGYSTRYLHSVFAPRVGFSPKQFCCNAKFQSSLRTLVNNPVITEEVLSHISGYYDVSHISRIYKKNLGMSPVQFSLTIAKG